jgi:hypothetical protein
MGIILGVIGCLIGLLSMTKPNLGVFAALAGAVSLSNLVAARRTRTILFGASALAALVLPIALMRHNLAPAGLYCLLESAAILLLVVELASSKPERSLSLKTFVAPVIGFAVALLAGAAYALATGTSWCCNTLASTGYSSSGRRLTSTMSCCPLAWPGWCGSRPGQADGFGKAVLGSPPSSSSAWRH